MTKEKRGRRRRKKKGDYSMILNLGAYLVDELYKIKVNMFVYNKMNYCC